MTERPDVHPRFSMLLVAALMLLGMTLPIRAAPPTEPIDTSAACTDSCHREFGTKEHVHKPAKNAKRCIKCHEVAQEGRHAFEPTPRKAAELCLNCHDDEMTATKPHLHRPFKTGKCTECHDPHQSDHEGQLKQPVGQLCLSCHDEFEEKQKHRHKPFRSGKCTKCHDPHQSDHEQQLLEPAPQLCLGCHDEFEEKRKHQHRPFKSGKCLKCHDAHQSPEPAQLREPAQQLCVGCHDDEEDFSGDVVHGPVAEGKCAECHNPHQTDIASLLQKELPQLCFTCHASALKDPQGQPLPALKRLFDDQQAKHHPPFAEGECSECHQPHVSANRRLLSEAYPADFYASYDPKAYALCFGCHESKAFEAPRTLSETRFRNGNLNLHYRHVNRAKGRTCGACHAPHGSHQEHLVNQAFQFGSKSLPLKFENTETGGSCTSACHSPIKYDRCQPEAITMRTTPRQGSDATAEQLQLACKNDQAKGKDDKQT